MPPVLNCPTGTDIFEWNTQTIVAGSTSATFTADSVGVFNLNITSDTPFVAGSPDINATNTGGFPAGPLSLFLNMNNNDISDSSVTTFTLPTAVPALQFAIYDVDFGAGSFADRIEVNGLFNGASVTPILTNGVANFVTGNVVIGNAISAATSSDANVTVTFLSPVDTIIIEYGNANTAPQVPGNQFANIADITYCNPEANLNVTKISNVTDDLVSSDNPKAIPGSTVRYCITVTNAGSGTATSISASDTLPADVTYIAGSLLSGTSCSNATTPEDDNDTDEGDEDDPFGISTDGATVTGIATELAPGASFAIVFSATVD